MIDPAERAPVLEKYELLEEIGRRMIRVRGDRFRIESSDGAEIALNLDGEPETARVFEFGLVPRAVRYHVGETDLVAAALLAAR